MGKTGRNRMRTGFTVVELVIVIAVIAILAAVLIPTFSSVMEKAHQSADIGVVTNINKMLAIEMVAEQGQVEFSKAKAVMEAGSYTIPCVPQAEHHTFYWMPEDNRVVLYDDQSDTVAFPPDFADRVKSGSWVSLSDGVAPVQGDEEDTPIEDRTYALVSGAQFNAALKSLFPSVTKIVFSKQKGFADMIGATSVSVSPSDVIKAYVNSTEIHVCCEGNMCFPSDISGMFKDFTSLQTISFANMDASAVTNMSKMFSGCSSLTAVNLSTFSTAKPTNMSNMFLNCSSLATLTTGTLDTSKVTTMENMFFGCERLSTLNLQGFDTSAVTTMKNMFYGCSGLSSIRVRSGAQGWNVTQVSSSSNMFGGCSQLKNYHTDLIVGEIPDIFGMDKWLSGLTHDKTYAHTGDDGYLTEA